MGGVWQYLLGVSQNVVAAGLALAAHHRYRVAPLLRTLAETAKECRCAEEAGTQAQAGSKAEGPR